MAYRTNATEPAAGSGRPNANTIPVAVDITGEDKEFLAPSNFSMVESGVYRCAFPRSKNIDFLKRLNLKTVVSLVPEEYPTAMADFYRENGINLVSHGLDGNKWPFKGIDEQAMCHTLADILDVNMRPLLIHCNKGKHRTGSVVGCLRKLRGWSLSFIFAEYLLYAEPKPRLEDQQFIELFSYSIDYLAKLKETDPIQVATFPAAIMGPDVTSQDSIKVEDITAGTATGEGNVWEVDTVAVVSADSGESVKS